MRLVSAVIVLMLSVVFLASGVAMRTIFAGPDTVTKEISVEHTAPALVIDGSALSAFPGRQLITVSPDEAMEDSTITLVYGRTVDVLGWLQPARFTSLVIDQTTGDISAIPRPGTESVVPNPLGSDLWFEQYRDTEPVRVSLTAGEGISVAIFSTGQSRAPGTVTISWPLDNATPLSSLLIILGVLLFIGGAVFLILAVTRIRRRRGPKKPAPITAPRRRAGWGKTPPRRGPSSISRGRRSAKRVAIVLIPALGLALGSCSADVTEQVVEEEIITGEAEGPTPYPVVTEAQFERIMARVSRQITAADGDLDNSLLQPRMSEPALFMREAAFRLRNADDDLGIIIPVPEGPVRVFVPQQTREWPRVVFAVIQDSALSDAPSLGVVLRQETPRSNYRLHYAVSLMPDTVLPAFPSPAVGASRLARTSQLLSLSPADAVSGYGDILRQGSDSDVWGQFDVLTDVLFTVVGPEGQELRQESFGSDIDVDLTITEPEYFSVALATSDNGAIVFGVLTEVETVRPTQRGATVNATSSARVFAGVPESTRGFQADYEIHILLYVPPVGSDDRIRLLGYSYQLVDAREAPESDSSEGS